MAGIQKLKDAIWTAQQEVAQAQKLRDEFDESLKAAKQLAAGDPKDEAFHALVAECEASLAEAEKSVAKEAEKVAALEAQLPEEFKPAAPKFDPEKHPLLKKTLEKPEVAQPIVLNTGDICEAFWPSDRSWYKAKIMSILGSASNPKYHVKYVDYDETQTLDADCVRPIQQKRKREEPVVITNPHVISGPAIANPATQTNSQDAATEDQPKKKKKVPSNKALERKVNNWKEWNSKGIGKKIQKESMFRTGTGVNSRVGFTGSGAGMTETTKRVRHDNKLDERLDIEALPESDQPRYTEGGRRSEDNGHSRYAPPGRGKSPTPTHRRPRF